MMPERKLPFGAEKTTLGRDIQKLKKAKNAVILAHNYQIEEVQLAADFIGDSLELSRKAAVVDQDLIVFAGVKFMAETAKILSPKKRVWLPRLDAGCPMADMITVEELRELKSRHAGARVVSYVNSSVEIKAESDVCCTSANAVNVVRHMESDKIIFVPDQNLGGYVQKLVPEKQIVLFEGYCYVHNRIKKWEVEETKRLHPAATIVAHPEVRMEILDMADQVLSTSGMLAFVKSSPNLEFIVLTEQGLIQRMKRENPEKTFFPAFTPKICQNMKKTSLRDIFDSLSEEKYEITITPAIREKAFRALQEMIKYD
jgi:quinolinate synthase